jgi:tRNA(Ile2)-agmatinylcytidine synthase
VTFPFENGYSLTGYIYSYNMRIGIDDTDSPAGMCTTYLGAVLVSRLLAAGIAVHRALLVRLNPNVIWKTRGNAAICLEAYGDPETAFSLACLAVEELADFSCETTNPGVVVAESGLPGEFYKKAVQDFCETDEAVAILRQAGARYRGYKNGRGLIGATAAAASSFEDSTWELLAYRDPVRRGVPRDVDRESLFASERCTFPHSWDSVDWENGVVVCVPHTPDPVLFGIRGESPAWVRKARNQVISENPLLEQIFLTNQGTDAHLVTGTIGCMKEGCSYLVSGTVTSPPVTARGGHVSFCLSDGDAAVRCMAYEPTKGFRDVVRKLSAGDAVTVAGSYKEGSINLEKLMVQSVAPLILERPPVCSACSRRMTSAGRAKGFKCRSCGNRSLQAERTVTERSLHQGWYEVPPSARRHLAKPLCRGPPPQWGPGCTYNLEKNTIEEHGLQGDR